MAETCYPVKVSHGHVKELVGKTSYLFLPTLIDMPTPEPIGKGLSIALWSKATPTWFAWPLRSIPQPSISPMIHLKYDPDTLALEISEQIEESWV